MKPSVNQQIADLYVENAVDLLRYGEDVRSEAFGLLYELDDRLADLVYGVDVLGVAQIAARTKRLTKLLDQAKRAITSLFKDVAKMADGRMYDLAELTNLQFGKVVGTVFKGALGPEDVALTPTDIDTVLSDVMVQGAPQADWWAKQGVDLTHRFNQQIRLGYVQGENNDKLVSRIIGSATGRKIEVTVDGESQTVNEYAGGVMDITRRDATALVRTSVQTVSNTVQEACFQDNQDILRGRQALVTLDNRTSEICMSRSGAAWDFDGKPLPESPVRYKFPGPPPWHFNCRTILIPIVKSWRELGAADVKGLDEIPAGTQSSMDGQVASDMTYEDWLKTKPEDFQRDVLGPGKYDLWSKGKIGLTQMVDQSGNALTLAQLRKKAGVDD